MLMIITSSADSYSALVETAMSYFSTHPDDEKLDVMFNDRESYITREMCELYGYLSKSYRCKDVYIELTLELNSTAEPSKKAKLFHAIMEKEVQHGISNHLTF